MTMKIKQTIKREETIEKEISLPYFCKVGERKYFKLITEERILIVKIDALWSQIDLFELLAGNTSDIAIGVEITEQEFNEAYHKALFEIGKYVPAPEVPKELLNDNLTEMIVEYDALQFQAERIGLNDEQEERFGKLAKQIFELRNKQVTATPRLF